MSFTKLISGTPGTMDSCVQARYVIISEDGKYGIYDRERNDSITAVDMDYIEYYHYFQPEGSMCFCYFYYEKGLQCGKIGINMNDNTKVEVFADNPRLALMPSNCVAGYDSSKDNMKFVVSVSPPEAE